MNRLNLTEKEKEIARRLYKKLKNATDYYEGFEHCIAVLEYKEVLMLEFEEYLDGLKEFDTVSILDYIDETFMDYGEYDPSDKPTDD